MRIEGRGTFYDGRSSRPVPVAFALDLARLSIADMAGVELASWPMANLRRADAGAGRVRIAREGEDARLEVDDSVAARALSVALRATPAVGSDWRGLFKVAGWMLAALASIAALLFVGIPALADRIAPLIPVSAEQKIGEAAKPQILSTLSGGKTPKLCRSQDGSLALRHLTEPLIAAAGAPLPVTVDVVDVRLPNAFALPGGSVILTRGLIEKVASPEELAGVFAHELGHVVHRDGMRGLLKSAGLSIVLGLIIGDFTGSSVAVLVGRTLIDAGYSRETEAMADAFAIDLMTRIGRDPAALGTALEAISKEGPELDGVLSWLSTHPVTAERTRILRAAGGRTGAAEPILDPAGWAALKAICR
ncbi:M48 family metallopeptidase [Prosthecomicrobium hirschii]|uniref:M48 family metallopeptidase n=1 Tax=Prosthecodimorpha hirschii TaxID=665126 RepID=UPI00221E4F0B|nr:M48 family metallopeptidase [Prosthecomicrobium hirschii]MCW1843856.1 M48 family metallopeptidase [Prosthecomicrobium hirschii]